MPSLRGVIESLIASFIFLGLLWLISRLDVSPATFALRQTPAIK